MANKTSKINFKAVGISMLITSFAILMMLSIPTQLVKSSYAGISTTKTITTTTTTTTTSIYNVTKLPPCCGKGDSDGDGDVDLHDIFHIIDSLFRNGPPPENNMDFDCDGDVDLQDVVRWIQWLFDLEGAEEPCCDDCVEDVAQ